MTMQLPSELTWALSMIGIDWPDADEDKLEAMGQAWLTYANTLRQLVDEVDKHAQGVWTGNKGDAIAAFQTSWTGADSPSTNLREGADAAALIAAGLATSAGIVTTFKLLVIAEVASFAATCAAAAMAASTGIGAILGVAGVVARRIIAQQVIDAAMNYAVNKVLNG